MVTARLVIERGSVDQRSEDWGKFDFLAMPSPGDRVRVNRGAERHYLTVLCTHHNPAATDGGDTPSAEVVARWTGSDDRIDH